MTPASTATALSLGRRVVGALAAARTPEEAATEALGEVGEAFGWQFGLLWLVDERTGLLRWGGDWAEDARESEFRESMRRLTFAPGVGVPGDVFAAVRPRWIEDVERTRTHGDDADVPRADAMLGAGLRTLVAVPAVSGGGPVGVLEFMAALPQAESGERVDAIALVGQMLAEYLTRVDIEARLRESRASSATIVRAALDCIVTMDHRGRVIDFNPAAEEVFGYDRDDVIGERLGDLIVPAGLRDAHHRALAAYVATGEPTILNRRLELDGMRADGSTFPVELTVTRLGTTDPPVFAGFLRDITARRQADDDRARLLVAEREARVRAEEAEQAARGAADALQRSLLPPHLPDVPGLALGAAYRAGAEGWQVGGDFYDVFELETGRWALVIGDVCGKGVEAASLAAMVRHSVRAAAVRHEAPRDVLADVNGAMLSNADRAFCTAIYATVELGGRQPSVCLAAAGHPLAFLVGADGSVREVGSRGTLLGAFGSATSDQQQVELAAGDLLVLYTDGVTEAPTPEGRFGHDRLAELLGGCAGRSPAETARRIENAVRAAATGEVADDLAILVVGAPGVT